MRKLSFGILFGLLSLSMYAQPSKIDSLKNVLTISRKDTNTVNTLNNIAHEFIYSHPDSAYYYGYKGMLMSKELHFLRGEAGGLIMMGDGLIAMGDYASALTVLLKGLKLAEQAEDNYYIEFAEYELAVLYTQEKDFYKAVEYSFKVLDLDRKMKDEFGIINALQNIGIAYTEMGKLDSALKYLNSSYKSYIGLNDTTDIHFSQINLAAVYIKLKMDKIALENYRLALPYITKNKISEALCETTINMAGIFQRMNEPDSAIYYGRKSLALTREFFFTRREFDASNFLASFYESTGKPDSAFKYLKLTISLKDSIFNLEKQQAIQRMTFDENIRQDEIATQKKLDEENHIRNLQLLAIGVFIPIFFFGVLFLSRTKVKPRVVEFLGILSLLLFFEFITDLIYPYISNLTNDRPVWEMLILVAIASLLEPMNHKLEHWVKERLVHKPVPVPIPLTVENISYDAE
jgi:tetratricopeptide (TPR) repeat protein